MNAHLNDGQLRSALDGELAQKELSHLEACAACQSRLDALRSEVRETSQKLSFLTPAQEESAPPVTVALKHFYDRKQPHKERSMFRKLFASPFVRYGAAAALVIGLIVAIPGTRALADQLLNLFRVEQVTVIPVDFSGLDQLNGNSALGKQFSQLISSSVKTTKDPGKPVDATDAADASQKTGFTVRLPNGFTTSRLTVLGEAGYDVTIDRTKAQALLDEAGRSDLVLPDNIDGAVVSINIPSSVRADYGTCPDPSQSDSGKNGSPGRNYPDCVILAEVPSPTVNAPANVDVSQLAEIGLEFTGMTSDQAAAFAKSVDWTTTLVVPIPKNASTYQQMTVDGVTGTLIQRPADDAPQFVLIWIKNGIVYSIGGLGSNSQQAIQMANSMP